MSALRSRCSGVSRGEHADEQHRELVAADPGDRVARPEQPCEPTRQRDEQVVADGVAEAVVDQLDAVGDIRERAGHPARLAVGVADREPAAEHPPPAAVCVAHPVLGL